MNNKEPISIFDELEKEQTFDHATVEQRLANFLIDLAVYYCFYFLLVAVTAFFWAYTGNNIDDFRDVVSNRYYSILIGYPCHFIYYTLLEGAMKGKSFGKLVTKTCAVNEDLSPISWGTATKRTLCRLIPFEIFSAFSGHPWHDRISKTYVVKKRKQVMI